MPLCPRCGHDNPAGSTFCSSCGSSMDAPPPPPPGGAPPPPPPGGPPFPPPPPGPGPGPYGGMGGPPPGAGTQVPDYFVPAIISTLCCCLPAGIASIVYSSKARSNRDMGNIPAALEASKQAKMWLIIAVVAGLAVGGIYFVAMAMGGSDSGY